MIWTQFSQDEDGATAIEYSLIASLVAIVAIGALITMASAITGTFETISDQVATAAS